MSTKVKKTTFTVTLLHSADLDVSDYSLEDIANDTDRFNDNSESVGAITKVVTVDVADDQIDNECKELASDGSFFDHLSDGDDE